MTIMNFELAHKRLAVDSRGLQRPLRPTPARPVHRPSVALILLASAVQIIGMAALLGTVANTAQ